MKATSPAKNRDQTDIIDFYFEKDPSMRLPSGLIWSFEDCRESLRLPILKAITKKIAKSEYKEGYFNDLTEFFLRAIFYKKLI